MELSSPCITLSVHPIGGTRSSPALTLINTLLLSPNSARRHAAGFAALSATLPIIGNIETEFTTSAATNGMNASFNKMVHCVAAEPYATFLRIGVSDEGHEMAYETIVLNRLRRGYRVLQLRSLLGTRIELCYMFVRVRFGREVNLWPSAAHSLKVQPRATHLSQ